MLYTKPARYAIVAFIAIMAASTAAPSYATDENALSLPSNIHAEQALHGAFRVLLDKSAIFRNQCARIAAVRRVVVIVNRRPPADSGAQARTTFHRYTSGLMIAFVVVSDSQDAVWLLAHEFEHVLEQIEGVNLRALARARAQRATEVERNVFETVRARDVGEAVAHEVYGSVGPDTFGRALLTIAGGAWRGVAVVARAGHSIFRWGPPARTDGLCQDTHAGNSATRSDPRGNVGPYFEPCNARE